MPLPPPIGSQRIWAGVVIFSSGVQFSGFTVEHAKGEGILAAGLGRDISGLSISRSAIVHNDLGFGFPKPKSSYFECAAAGQIPGDCGEGIHFTGVAFSSITGNLIAFNSGGTLLSDDTGPTHGNLVANNVVTGNSTDCGITMPGHNPGALNATGQRQPSVAGVYDNVIRNNVVTNNGLKGEGAGVLFANASAGPPCTTTWSRAISSPATSWPGDVPRPYPHNRHRGPERQPGDRQRHRRGTTSAATRWTSRPRRRIW